jgi:diguanylate cyclase (GGDEF)-like protein
MNQEAIKERYSRKILPTTRRRALLDKLGRELLAFLENPGGTLQPVFQPIINLRSRTVFAHEALIRGAEGSPLQYPNMLFTCAQDFGLEEELDWAARTRTLEEYNRQQSSRYLFINVNAEILSKQSRVQEWAELLEFYDIQPEQVVIEITEQTPITKPKRFIKTIDQFRERGFQVALDDLGTGYNGLKLWSELRPEFVKLDKHFIASINKDAEKHRFIETMHTLANSMNSQVIAEGVETEEDLDVLERLGIPFVQGYLFLKPQPKITDEIDYTWSVPDTAKLTDEEKVGQITRQVRSISPDMTVYEVADLFHNNEGSEFFPVVHDGKAFGMVWRHELMDKLASRFGRDLYFRQGISKLMDKNPIIVDRNLPVENLSRVITEYQYSHKGNAFIVTDNNAYLGCGEFLDLLRYITDLKIKSAQYSNPLSGLPGNVPIQKTMQAWLDNKIHFALLYIDLDHFKPYNDHYSYEQGDSIIRAISALLQRYVPSHDDFLGHIGGDDFIMLIRDINQAEEIAQVIINDFNDMISSFYRLEDIANGGINGIDRDGNPKFFKMMSMSIGLVITRPGHIEHQQKLSSIATRSKKQAKEMGGNNFHTLQTTGAE